MRVTRCHISPDAADFIIYMCQAEIGVVGGTLNTIIVVRPEDENGVLALFPDARLLRTLEHANVAYTIEGQEPDDVQAQLEAYKP